jgi:hypothetical protein
LNQAFPASYRSDPIHNPLSLLFGKWSGIWNMKLRQVKLQVFHPIREFPEMQLFDIGFVESSVSLEDRRSLRFRAQEGRVLASPDTAAVPSLYPVDSCW